MTRVWVGISVLILLAAQPAMSAVSVTHTATPNAAHIGDIITYSITIEKSKTDTFVPPAFTTQIGPFQILRSATKKTKTGDGHRHTWTYEIAGYELGKFAIPSLAIKTNAAGKSTRLPEIPITITSIRATDAPLTITPVSQMPNAGYIDLSFSWGWYLGALLLIGLIGAVLLWLRARWQPATNGQGTSFAVQDTRPAHMIALEKIKSLENQKLWETGQSKRHYFALTTILKEYLTDTFDRPILEMTSAELITEMHSLKINEQTQKRLKNVIQLSDLTKFAEHVPTDEQTTQTLAKAADIVRRIQAEVSPPPEPEQAEVRP